MFVTNYGNFNGTTWESMFQVILKRKYMDQQYQTVVASPGDFGIEGFTRNGLTFQCYCPDVNEDNKRLYERQRDKITKDINKLNTNKEELTKILGGIKLCSWTLITPRVGHHDLLSHCNEKRDLIKSWNLSFIDNDRLEVLLHDCDDYAHEIGQYFEHAGKKFSIKPNAEDIKGERMIEWKKSEISLVKNALSKNEIRVRAYSNQQEKANMLTDEVVKNYLNGESILRNWQSVQPESHQRFTELVASLEDELKERCLLSEIEPNKFIEQIKLTVEEKINSAFPLLDESTIIRLKNYCTSFWILTCPIYFEEESNGK